MFKRTHHSNGVGTRVFPSSETPNESARPALSASGSAFLTPGRMASDGESVNADVAVSSIQPKLGATGRMASLVSRIVDFCHILNAQLRFLGRINAPFSVRLRGRVHLSGSGEVVLGEGVSLNGTVVPVELNTYASGRIEIGSHTFINYGSSIAARASVKIGSYCHLGHYLFVMDNDQHDVVRHWQLPPSEPVVIEDDVWIGSKVIILPGVRIGSRAVIGAGSIVTKDIPPRCVAAGNPARVIRHLEDLD
jgi:acetyltransferase-like isoleucine patch superfamily enzyme